MVKIIVKKPFAIHVEKDKHSKEIQQIVFAIGEHLIEEAVATHWFMYPNCEIMDEKVAKKAKKSYEAYIGRDNQADEIYSSAPQVVEITPIEMASGAPPVELNTVSLDTGIIANTEPEVVIAEPVESVIAEPVEVVVPEIMQAPFQEQLNNI